MSQYTAPDGTVFNIPSDPAEKEQLSNALKKTYPDTKEMIAKVDSIILTLIDFKDKTDDYIKQKNKGIKLLIKKKAFEY
jgi:hypothetical protein